MLHLSISKEQKDIIRLHFKVKYMDLYDTLDPEEGGKVWTFNV